MKNLRKSLIAVVALVGMAQGSVLAMRKSGSVGRNSIRVCNKDETPTRFSIDGNGRWHNGKGRFFKNAVRDRLEKEYVRNSSSGVAHSPTGGETQSRDLSQVSSLVPDQSDAGQDFSPVLFRNDSVVSPVQTDQACQTDADTRLDQVNTRLDQHDKRLDQHDQQLSALERWRDKEVNPVLAVQQVQIDQQRIELGQQGQELGRVEALAVKQFAEKLAVQYEFLKDKQSEMADQFQELTSKNEESLAASAALVKAQYEEIDRQLTEVKRQQAAVDTRLAQHDQQLSELERWRDEEVKPALADQQKQIDQQRIELEGQGQELRCAEALAVKQFAEKLAVQSEFLEDQQSKMIDLFQELTSKNEESLAASAELVEAQYVEINCQLTEVKRQQAELAQKLSDFEETQKKAFAALNPQRIEQFLALLEKNSEEGATMALRLDQLDAQNAEMLQSQETENDIRAGMQARNTKWTYVRVGGAFIFAVVVGGSIWYYTPAVILNWLVAQAPVVQNVVQRVDALENVEPVERVVRSVLIENTGVAAQVRPLVNGLKAAWSYVPYFGS